MLSTESLERQLLEALPFTVYTLDLDGRIASIHAPAARFGDEAVPLHTAHDADARDTDAHERHVWELGQQALSRDEVEGAMQRLRTGKAAVARWEIAHGDGPDRRVALAQLTPLHDDAHSVTGFALTTTDVTGGHRLRAAVRDAGAALSRALGIDRVCYEAAQQLRHALRPDAIVIAVTDPHDQASPLRIVYDTGIEDRRAAERRFGTAWRAALVGNELQTTRADGCLETTAPLVGESGPIGVLTIVADEPDAPERSADARQLLTAIAGYTAGALERSRAAARSEQQRRLSAIGEVAAGVAQELRNPIFGISSAAQLLRFRAREDPVMEKNVGRILREVERLNRMVGTLAELGRPMVLKRSPTDPDMVWDDVLETERGRLESRVIAVDRSRAEPRTGAPATLPIDAEQLAQAFRSILSNAVEAAPEASDIRLTATTLPNGGWRCQLTNGGPPIAPDLLPHVFDLFVSTKPGSPGTGLAMARRIVEEHGGAISIESDAATGTTVSVTLPAGVH